MEGLGLIVLVVAAVVVLIYYGMGKNVEVGSRMITRELVDAERMQKERIVNKYANRSKEDISDANFKKAVSTIERIDSLDI